MLKTCPHFFRGRLRQCFIVVLQERYRARQVGDIQAEERAWKVFGLVRMMLMHRPRGTGSVGRDELSKRADGFARGRWTELLENASETEAQPRSTTVVRSETEHQLRRGHAALSRVRRGQLSRAGGHGASVGSQNAGHSRTVAAETTPRKGDGDLTRSYGIHARQTSRTGSCTLYQVLPECTFWLRTAPRRLQQ